MSYRFNGLAIALALAATAAFTSNAAGGPAQSAQAPMQGRLEMVWGDAPQQPHRFQVNLVDDAGRRHALDPERAARAAGDLHALFGRRVAVSFAPQTKAAGAAGLAQPEAIVPVDDLGAKNTSSTRAGDVSIQAVTGTTTWATLMCKFKDYPAEQKPRTFFQGQYGNNPGQLDHYWREVSYNQINLTGSNAYGWFTLPLNRGFYFTTGPDGKPKANLDKLFDDCTAVANASVNFAANGGLQGINMMFNEDLDGYAWGGGRCATLDGINKCWSATWNPPWSFNNLAPLAHEMGHAYGLPHANNSDGDTDTYDNPWDNMSDAWNNVVVNPTYGSLPKHISTYSRDRLGWIPAARKRIIAHGSPAQFFTLQRASLVGATLTQMVVLPVPGSTTRYYTVEARLKTGYYEPNLAGDAVIIHSVDTSRAQPAWSVDAASPPATVSNNEGSMFKVGETWTSPDAQKFRVRVDAATAQGFNITVTSF